MLKIGELAKELKSNKIVEVMAIEGDRIEVIAIGETARHFIPRAHLLEIEKEILQ